jgi:hypothetical protein
LCMCVCVPVGLVIKLTTWEKMVSYLEQEQRTSSNLS